MASLEERPSFRRKPAAVRVDEFLARHFTRPAITWRQAFAILLPLMAENLFSNLFGLLNTAMISASGVTSLSAVSLVDTLNSFLYVLYTGISTGASVIVANYRGRHDAEKLHESSVQAVTSVTSFTILTTMVIVLFNAPLLRLLFGAAEAEVMTKARLYMLGTALTLPIIGVTSSTCGVLRGIGEGKTSLGYTLVATGKYVALNVLFLKVLKLGIPGLILSITLSRIMDLGILWLFLKRSHSQFVFRFREFFRINPAIVRSILRVGLPCAAESLFFTGGRVVTQAIIVPMGTYAIATYNISYSIMILSQILVGAVNTGMFTITGICIGSGREQDVRELTKSYFILNTILYTLGIGVIRLAFRGLVNFYHAPEEIIPTVFLCVMSSTIAQPIIHNFAFMLPNVFRAAGDGRFCTGASLIVMWLFRVGGGWLLGAHLGMGVVGIWIAMLIDWVVRACIFPARMRGSRWLRHKVLKD